MKRFLLFALPLLALACTATSHTVTIDENGVAVWGKDVADEGQPIPTAAATEEGGASVDSNGRRYIVVNIYQGVTASTSAAVEAALTATLEKWFSTNPD